MALPLGLRNRLAELILGAFDREEARQTLAALATFCENPAGRLPADAEARLVDLGWFRRGGEGGIRLLGDQEPHLPALCRRVGEAWAALRDRAKVPEGGTLAGLLARAARLADRGLYFEVHEILEPAWMRAGGAERVALQGLIQVAAALHHMENDNGKGALSLLSEGLAKLGTARSALPLDTRPWEAGLATALTALREGRPPGPAPSWPTPQTLEETAWRSC